MDEKNQLKTMTVVCEIGGNLTTITLLADRLHIYNDSDLWFYVEDKAIAIFRDGTWKWIILDSPADTDHE